MAMSLTITTLIENSPGEHKGLRSEHGLSFHVSTGSHSLLFDTGQSGAIVDNAARLRVDLVGLDHVVLSHGHYDHSGGLRALAGVAEGFSLTVGRGFFAPKYATRGGAHDYLGNDFDPAFVDQCGIPWSYLDEPLREIAPGAFMLSGFSRTHSDETVNPRFVIRTEHGFVPDRFDDEVLLALDSPRGLVVLLGCSHPGVRNMLDAVRERLGRPLYAVLGGTHLVETASSGQEAALDYFRKHDVRVVGVSHCTGEPATDLLKGLGERFFHNRTGSSLIVD
jgi:7,8-dihydropterin-6-yl-methyl-4-(beta-D-ribofuranosyl)aminobenzene 5'-phosphate synthase